jgi:glycerate kinase
MRSLVAPTAYKGTLSPTQAAQVIAANFDGEVDLCPIADGGTGWLEVWAYQFPDAQRHAMEAHDALLKPRRAEWLLLPSGAAVIESAQAIGLHLLAQESLAPLQASSQGVGEMLASAAAHAETRALWLGLGGVATTDAGAGAGALCALGFRLLDAAGNSVFANDPLREVPPASRGNQGAVPLAKRGEPKGGGKVLPDVPSSLLALHAIEPPPTDPLHGKPLTLCADVQNTLLDAARVFAPQKGATPQQTETLVRALEHFAEVALRDTGIDLTATVGAGAAGGLAGGLHAYLRAPIVSGVMWLLHQVDWDARLRQADCLITGEGQVDAQTLMGKGVGVLIQQAVALGKPVVVLAGRKGAGWEPLARLPRVQVYACTEVAPDLPPEEALAQTTREAFSRNTAA